jgi:hypothetical protein
VEYPPDLLDELARVFARVALEKLLEELAAEERRRANGEGNSMSEPSSTTRNVVDGEIPG